MTDETEVGDAQYYCFLGEGPVASTDEIRDAWSYCPSDDEGPGPPDVMTEDGTKWWTFTEPVKVKLRRLSCGCCWIEEAA